MCGLHRQGVRRSGIQCQDQQGQGVDQDCSDYFFPGASPSASTTAELVGGGLEEEEAWTEEAWTEEAWSHAVIAQRGR